MPSSTKKRQPFRGQRGRRGPTGRRGPVGPGGHAGATGAKGEPGAWPTEAFDLLDNKIERLRRDVDDIRATLAEMQEDLASSRFSRSRRTEF